MEALVIRLSQLDSEAEGALRIVMFYDTLMRRRVDLAGLARASAALAEHVTGIRLNGTGQTIRFAPDGRAATAPSLNASTTMPITLDEEYIGTVWLERPGPPGPLDQLLLERLAIAAAAVLERYGPAHTTMADPALVELVINADSDEAATSRALRLLGFAADLPLRIAAVRTRLPLDKVGMLISPRRHVKAAALADVGVILASAIDVTRFPPDTHAGIGTAARPDQSWRHARTALDFTTPRQPVVSYDSLGALALLAHIPRDAARENCDTAAIARLAPEELDTLDAYCTTASLRRAADLLHLHHTSVARRLEHIGKAICIDLTAPAGLTRAQLALTTWRLLDK